jgi:hypothetical protein
MKAFLKRAFQRLAADATADVSRKVSEELAPTQRGIARENKEAQLALFHMYRDLVQRGVPLPRLDEVGFRCHSQFEEDGILLFLFAVIGYGNKTAVEICAGNGIECNTANLILNHGWWGYLFDGDERRVAIGTAFYRDSVDTFLYPPRFKHAWITAENVNDLIRGAGIEGEIDLLSLDVDGMDYWIWRAIECIRPRVVVCETHNIIAPDDALTIPYDPHFVISVPDHHSASLAAMAKLAAEKGYRLVGTHRYGFNAFFILNGIADELLPAVTPRECLKDPYSREGHAVRWPRVSRREWVRV